MTDVIVTRPAKFSAALGPVSPIRLRPDRSAVAPWAAAWAPRLALTDRDVYRRVARRVHRAHDPAISLLLMRYASAAAIGLGVMAWSSFASAYRPFDSTDAAVAKEGELELEIGPVGYLRESGDRSLVAPALIVNAGIWDRWELVLEARHRVRLEPQADESRLVLGDAALSVKHVLREGTLQDKSGLSAATEIGALLPATDEETAFGATAALIVSGRLGFLTAHLNGGGFISRTHHPGGFAGLILEGPFDRKNRPVSEVFVERETDVGTVVSGLVGAIWPARDDLSFDVAARAGRAFDSKLFELRAGLTWAFEL
jgi:hypothetical protein